MTLVPRNAFVNELWLKLGGVVPALCLLLLCAECIFGQADTGRITGTASDASGAVVPGVRVTIVSVETNLSQTFVTDNTGSYSSGPLRVGVYRLEAQSPGFKRLVRDAISLQVQETAVVNLQLELGEISQEVRVTATESLVRTADASQG